MLIYFRISFLKKLLSNSDWGGGRGCGLSGLFSEIQTSNTKKISKYINIFFILFLKGKLNDFFCDFLDLRPILDFWKIIWDFFLFAFLLNIKNVDAARAKMLANKKLNKNHKKN